MSLDVAPMTAVRESPGTQNALLLEERKSEAADDIEVAN